MATAQELGMFLSHETGFDLRYQWMAQKHTLLPDSQYNIDSLQLHSTWNDTPWTLCLRQVCRPGQRIWPLDTHTP